MSSNSYSHYNYPYHQSSAQQYSGYQTAPATNNAKQPSRQYQQAPPVSTAQADYMSYPAQDYSGQSSAYSGEHDSSWTASNYGANREITSRAAEVLHNMSNTTYSPNTTASVSQSGFTATNSATANSGRYSTGANRAQQVQPPQHAHATHSAYGTSQTRPRSVNTNPTPAPEPAASHRLSSPANAAVYPPQRAQNTYNQQQQRSASPAQTSYAHRNNASVNAGRSTAMVAAGQFNDYNQRQLPNVEAPRNTQSATVSTIYGYADHQVSAPVVQTTSTANVSEQYNQNAVTVDPMAVYDPWPEYQRKQEAIRAQKIIEDAVRAEKERKAEVARLEEERKEEDEREKLEEEERARNPVPMALPPTQPKIKKVQPSKTAQKQQSNDAGSSNSGATEGSSEDPATKLENEIRAMMAKMRELNGKDPALLARIWEEERRLKGPKPPTAQTKPAPQPTPEPAAVHPVQASTPSAAVQRKRPVPKDASSATSTKATASTATQPPASRPHAQAVISIARPAGNTIWPAEKKTQLANVAAEYLTAQNPSKSLDAEKVLSMLDGNPSYIELCEQLEAMGLKLDRAAFAKNLLSGVPDINSASRPSAPRAQPIGVIAQRVQAPPAILANRVASAAPSPHPPPEASLLDRRSFPPFPDNRVSASHSPVPIAEMVPIKAELKPPANKEEAARKRNFNDLVDLTLLSEEETREPPLKKQNVNSMYSSYDSPGPMYDDMEFNQGGRPINNFPVPASVPHAAPISVPAPQYAPRYLRHANLVQPLDRKKALRRNTYNIKTIARDVLLACGRHPDERQLNGHLDILRINLPQINTDADLSTIRWDIIDPGEPPQGYFKYGVYGADADDADNESTDAEDGARAQVPTRAIGSKGMPDARVQALPEATNPFKVKRRGRPPRHSYPMNPTTPETPHKTSANSTNMSASAPRPTSASIGYSAFRVATEYGPDGKPLPKKKGRPVGWRKAIHGSPQAQSRTSANGHIGPIANRFVPHQSSTLRNVRTGNEEQIIVNSRSPSLPNKVPRYRSFKCKWQNCEAELHNLETLKKHVLKVHHKETLRGTLECLWRDCGKEMITERHIPFAFTEEAKWREHLDEKHFSPISWDLGDGPASGLSDAHDSEAYLSDAQGRQVTPRITVDPARPGGGGSANATLQANPAPAQRGRGRPPKVSPAGDTQKYLVSQKKRVGGPGMDRGGATLVTKKRRKGFSDNDEMEEEFVDAEDRGGI